MTGEAMVVRTVAGTNPVTTPWGELRWLVGASLVPGARQTFGVVRIDPGHENPLHAHPNCEELLYVVSGTCRHRLGDSEVDMGPGSVIVIPEGTPHNARCTSDTPLQVVISFSSGDRQTIDLA